MELLKGLARGLCFVATALLVVVLTAHQEYAFLLSALGGVIGATAMIGWIR